MSYLWWKTKTSQATIEDGAIKDLENKGFPAFKLAFSL